MQSETLPRQTKLDSHLLSLFQCTEYVLNHGLSSDVIQHNDRIERFTKRCKKCKRKLYLCEVSPDFSLDVVANPYFSMPMTDSG